MPNDKNSTTRGASFRQRVKANGGTILTGAVLTETDIARMETVRQYIAAVSGAPTVSKGDIVRFSLLCAVKAINKETQKPKT